MTDAAKMKMALGAAVLCFVFVLWPKSEKPIAIAESPAKENRLPNSTEIDQLKRLAALSVEHVETSLKKIAQPSARADPYAMQSQVIKPARDLIDQWQAFPLSDAVMMSYSSCTQALGELHGMLVTLQQASNYLNTDGGKKKMKFEQEDLNDCRTLRTTVPDFPFYREK